MNNLSSFLFGFKYMCLNILLGVALVLVSGIPCIVYANQEKQDRETGETGVQQLAKKLQNPVAKLTNFQFQNNFEHKLGADGKGYRYTLRFQPVIPMSLNDNWNFIFRPIIPYIYQHKVIGNASQEGLGDIQVENTFSPVKRGPGGITWGLGPIFLFPTATSDHLGSQKYGIGPNGIILKQSGPWTALILANHTWSYAGNDKRNDVSLTYLQPVLAHSTKKGFTISVSSESTYDWKGENWTVPFICTTSQILPFGKQYISVGLGGIYYLRAPTSSPEWGIRLNVTFLFPEGLHWIKKTDKKGEVTNER
jgi:hypothetical protein